MNARGLANTAQVLLIEPNRLVRGTVASVCRDLQLIRLHQATSLSLGEQHLLNHRVHGLMLSMTEDDAAIHLLERLRAGAFVCEAQVAVMVMANACTKEQAVRLKALDVRRLLLQPFRVRDVIHTVEELWPSVVPSAPQRTPGVVAAS